MSDDAAPDFRIEARAALQLLGTAVEEGRMSLPLAALQLAAVYRRHRIVLSEVTAGATIARWVGSRPGAEEAPETYVPPGESAAVTTLRAEIALLDHLAGLAQLPDAEQIRRMRHARARMLHGMGHTVEEAEARR